MLCVVLNGSAPVLQNDPARVRTVANNRIVFDMGSVGMRMGELTFCACFMSAPTLPAGAGCAVYVRMDGHKWEYVGFIWAQTPSKFFKICAEVSLLLVVVVVATSMC
jgi:hypothetical protein